MCRHRNAFDARSLSFTSSSFSSFGTHRTLFVLILVFQSQLYVLLIWLSQLLQNFPNGNPTVFLYGMTDIVNHGIAYFHMPSGSFIVIYRRLSNPKSRVPLKYHWPGNMYTITRHIYHLLSLCRRLLYVSAKFNKGAFQNCYFLFNFRRRYFRQLSLCTIDFKLSYYDITLLFYVICRFRVISRILWWWNRQSKMPLTYSFSWKILLVRLPYPNVI